MKPTEEPVRRSRIDPVIDLPQPTEPIGIEAPRIDVHANGTSGGDQSTMVMLDHLWEKLRDLESTVAAEHDGPSANARLEAVSNAVGGIAGGLDRLVGEVRGLQALPVRLEKLEAEVKQKQGGRVPYDQTLPDTVSRLAGKVGDLEKVRGRVEALERVVPGDKAGTGESARQLEQLSTRLDALEKLNTRVTALEQAKRTSTDRDLGTLAGRVTALERAKAPSADGGDASKALEQLSTRVAALEKAPKDAPDGNGRVPSERLAALEKVVGGLVQGLERLSSKVAELDHLPKRLAELDDLPKRLAALEGAKAPSAEKVLTSISKRLDRLSTQVYSYKDVPGRLQAAEQASARSDVLSRGLHRAIESIDHLSAQVTALQAAMPEPAATASTPAPAPTPPAPPSGPPQPTPAPSSTPTPTLPGRSQGD
ncbi:MAG: hypothetical protein M3P53_10380 [Actinomycetota bacterium]|nr:hypothetical protein [Actinomycetota bacterium]